jgi:tetratricopeptide (TPR) repeat protein
MVRRLCYALLTAALATLVVLFGARLWRGERQELPRVDAPAEIAGGSCADGLRTAQALTRSGALEQARVAYLWLIGHCDSPVLPDALLEAGSLFGHLMDRPSEARRAYREFLRRFPNHPDAADVTYHLAKLELDAGDYASAVAHLTALAEASPDSEHAESARFLAARAAQMLAANQRSQRTATGQLWALVPNNVVSLLAVLAAIGPSAIQTMRQARRESARWRWMVPALVVGLTLLNSIINNVDNARRNALVMEKLDRLLQSQETP